MARSARTPRCFVDAPLEVNTSLELDKGTSHHLSTVLRLKDGSTAELFNGDGHDYTANLRIDGKRIVAEITSVRSNTCESPVNTLLLQGISRGDRMDTTIQKAVELGVNRIVPVYTRHAIRPLDAQRAERKREHWQQVATSALEQSGRASRIAVEAPCDLPEALAFAAAIMSPASQGARTLSLALSPGASDSLAGLVSRSLPLGSLALLIGPESGLDDDELSQAVDNGWQTVRLGPRILRTETAAMTALATVQAMAGDLA